MRLSALPHLQEVWARRGGAASGAGGSSFRILRDATKKRQEGSDGKGSPPFPSCLREASSF